MAEFTNEVLDLDSLPKYDEVNLSAPDPKYWKVILIDICIFFGILGAALITSILLIDNLRVYGGYIIAGFLLALLFTLILYRASFKKRGFALREKDIIYKSGIIAATTSIIPLNRIQHVALDEGLFSRIYKLATLQIHTAGVSGNMNIAGIPADQARTIKEMLLKKLDSLAHSANNDE